MSATSRVLSVRTSGLIHGCGSHSHPSWEIIYQLEGCASETVGNDAWDLIPGTITLIPAGVPHTKESPGGFRDASMLVSHLDFADHPFTVRDTDGSIRTLTELLIRTRIRQDTGWESEADALLEAITVFIRLRMDKSPPMGLRRGVQEHALRKHPERGFRSDRGHPAHRVSPGLFQPLLPRNRRHHAACVSDRAAHQQSEAAAARQLLRQRGAGRRPVRIF
ncbi:MAG: AraC family ligand binding domain-containing protein [Clostridia bacterium]|nr:AraC family ligand binding domain-containing protein [Clostridia bacterium]